VVLHILSGVLAGVVAWFQRFPGPGDVREQDECATRAPSHIHPVSWGPGRLADPRDPGVY